MTSNHRTLNGEHPMKLTRRTMLGATAAAVTAGYAGTRLTRAQTPASGFSGNATITSWGFNAIPTNPLAYGRVQAFQQAYPNIQLQLTPPADTQKILTAAASNTLPDLLWLSRSSLNSYISRGKILLPLDDLIKRDGYDMSRFYPSTVQESTYGGKVYGIPGGVDIQVVYMNLDALAEVGITDPTQVNTGDWHSLTDLGTKLTKKSGDVVQRWGFDSKMQDGFVYTWGLADGASFLTNDDKMDPTFNNDKVVETVDWATQAYKAQGGYTSYDSVRSTWQNDEQFARGQVAITGYQSWLLDIISKTTPNLNFAVSPMRPRNDPNGAVSTTGGNAWCISANSKNVDAAWEFIKFMHTDDTWMKGAQAVVASRQQNGQPYLPSLTAVPAVDQAQIDQLYKPINANSDAAVKLFPQILATSAPRPVGRSPYAEQLDQILTDTGILPALRGDKSAADALKAAQDEAESAVQGF